MRKFITDTIVRNKGDTWGYVFIRHWNYSTLANIRVWLSVFRKLIKKEDIPTIMVGIMPIEKDERQVTTEEGKKIAKSLNVNGFIEYIPKTGENVEKAFESLTRLILDRLK